MIRRRPIPDHIERRPLSGNGQATNGHMSGNGEAPPPRYNGVGKVRVDGVNAGYGYGEYNSDGTYKIPLGEGPYPAYSSLTGWHMINRPTGPRRLGFKEKYQPWFAQAVFELRLCGAPDKQIARLCNIDEQHLRMWLDPVKGIPEFIEAYEKGGELADAKVSAAMYLRAVGYTHPDEKIFYDKDTASAVRIDTIKHYPPDPGAGQFWLTNRQRHNWRNRTTNEMVDQEGNTLIPPQLIVVPVSAQKTNGKVEE